MIMTLRLLTKSDQPIIFDFEYTISDELELFNRIVTGDWPEELSTPFFEAHPAGCWVVAGMVFNSEAIYCSEELSIRIMH
jgi:hypothetical protein